MTGRPEPSLGDALRRIGKRAGRRGFELGQRVGLDILPRHFYSQVPNLAALRSERGWRAPRTMVGVRGTDLDGQAAFLEDCCPAEVRALLPPGLGLYEAACEENGALGYGPLEALFLFCFIASKRPRRIIQIGAGVSTAVMLEAARRAERAVEIVCVDPFPTPMLRRRHDAGEIVLVDQPAQAVPLARLTGLEAGDLLFIDSTHTVKAGSEVNLLLLEVLPRLAPGVFVHLHDVTFPYDHGPGLLEDDLFFWNESVLLHALLVDNRRLSVALSLSMVHHDRPEILRRAFPAYRPAPTRDGLWGSPDRGHFPSSIYLLTH